MSKSIAAILNLDWESISSTQKAYYLRKVGQVLTEELTVITLNQEEKVLEALRRSLVTTLVRKGNKSRACAVKKERTKDQLSILQGVPLDQHYVNFIVVQV